MNLLHKGRKQELEADRLGAQYALRAGYEPIGIAKRFTTFKRLSNSNIPTLLSTHPEHDKRIISNLIQSEFFYPKRNDYVVSTNDFESARDDLLALAPVSIKKSEEVATAFVSGIEGITQDTVMERFEKILDKSIEENEEKAEKK